MTMLWQRIAPSILSVRVNETERNLLETDAHHPKRVRAPQSRGIRGIRRTGSNGTAYHRNFHPRVGAV